MNAPLHQSKIDNGIFKFANIDHLVASKTNPRTRKGFDAASLGELAQSIKSVGIAQPILVREVHRPIDKEKSAWPFHDCALEIIAGERRYRAAKLAGLTEVPVLQRDMSDIDMLKLQLIENVQRQDLDALEEAEGYEKLLQQTDAEGNRFTKERLAELMGVSRSTIYARCKLLELCQDARQAFYDGKLDASTALLIARIPVERVQLQALKKISIEMDWGNSYMTKGEKMSFRRARELIQSEFMLYLDRSIFAQDDATLLPKAGSCTDCPKRTGNAPDLFDDVDDPNVCTDTVCFGMKKAAHILVLQKQAEARGDEVIAGKQAKKLISNQYSDTTRQLREHGYATLDTPVPGDKKKRTLGEVLEASKSPVQKTIVANPYCAGEMIETVSIEAATKALREAGFEITLKTGTTKQTEETHAKDREKEQQKTAIENTYRGQLFDALHAQIETAALTPHGALRFDDANSLHIAYRHLATQLLDNHDYYALEDLIIILRKFTALPEAIESQEIDWHSHIAEFRDNIHNLTPAQHLMLIIELPLLSSELSCNQYSREAQNMHALAKDFGIDAAAIRKEVETKAKAEQKEAAKAAKKTTKPAAEPMPEATPKPATKVRPAATWPFPGL